MMRSTRGRSYQSLGSSRVVSYVVCGVVGESEAELGGLIGDTPVFLDLPLIDPSSSPSFFPENHHVTCWCCGGAISREEV